MLLPMPLVPLKTDSIHAALLAVFVAGEFRRLSRSPMFRSALYRH
jgi:hypothetical protein